jgi:hypothetical protein
MDQDSVDRGGVSRDEQLAGYVDEDERCREVTRSPLDAFVCSIRGAGFVSSRATEHKRSSASATCPTIRL